MFQIIKLLYEAIQNELTKAFNTLYKNYLIIEFQKSRIRNQEIRIQKIIKKRINL